VARALHPSFVLAAAVSNVGSVALRLPDGVLGRVERAAFLGQVLVAGLVCARAVGLPLPSPARKVAGVATYLVVSQYASVLGLVNWFGGKQGAVWSRARRQPLP
jgi:hypothetical protein